MNDQPLRQSRWMLLLVVAAVTLWGVYLAIGAYRGPNPAAANPVRGWIVLACFGWFLGIWMLLLLARRRRLRR